MSILVQNVLGGAVLAIPVLYPLDAKSLLPPVVTIQNVSTHHQTSLEGKIAHLRATGLPGSK